MQQSIPQFKILSRFKPLLFGWGLIILFVFLYDSGISSINDLIFKISNETYSVEAAEGFESTLQLTLSDGSKLSASLIEGTILNGVLVGKSTLKGENGAILNVNFDNGELIDGEFNYEIKDYSITTNKLAEQSVTNTKIVDGTITAGKLSEGIIVTNLLGNNVVTSVKIADGAITSTKLLDNIVVTSKIADGAVTEIKLADGSITNGKIVDLAITGNKISAGTITQINLADGTIGEAKIEDGAISEMKILNGSISLSKLSSLMCTTGEILKKTLTGWECSIDVGTGSVTAGGGLSNSGTVSDPILDVNVDNLTIELVGDALQVREEGIESLQIANETITNEDIAILANIEWSKINKTGSSIADLTSKSFSDLTGRLAQYVEIQDTANFFTATDTEGTFQEIGSNYFRLNGNSFGSTATIGTNDNNVFRIETNGIERMRIRENGYVGIGTNLPGFALEITSSDGNFVTKFRNQSTGSTILVSDFVGDNVSIGGTVSIGLGKSATNYNRANIFFNYIGEGSLSNRLGLGFFGTSEFLSLLANGNVGIGTTNPAAKLQVLGNTAIGDITAMTQELLTVGYGNVRIASGNKFFFETAGTGNSIYRETLSGDTVLTGGGIRFGSGSLATEYARFSSSGNFGIGTTNTTTKLSVNGIAKIGNFTEGFTTGYSLLVNEFIKTTGINFRGPTVGDPAFTGFKTNDSGNSSISVWAGSSEIAVFDGYGESFDSVLRLTGGNFNPSSGSTIKKFLDINPGLQRGAGYTGDSYGLYVSPSYSGDSSSANFYSAFFGGGNVGIGDSSPLSLFTVGSGDLFQVNSSGAIIAATGITSSGTITFSGISNCSSGIQTNGSGVLSCLPSDESLKENVDQVSNALSIVNDLRGVTFNWKENLYGAQKEYGFIAQEVEEVAPELVFTMGSGLKGVKYAQFTGLLVEAIKEQQILIDQINAKLSTSAISENIIPQDTIGTYLSSNIIPNLTVNNLKINEQLEVQTIKVLASSEFFGKLFVRNSIEVDGDIVSNGKIIGSSNTSGRATLPAGSTNVVVNFATPYQNIPVVNITPIGAGLSQQNVQYYIDNQTTSGFEIVITSTLSSNLQFNWIAIGSSN